VVIFEIEMSNEVNLRECPGCSAMFQKRDGFCDKYGVMSQECYRAFLAVVSYEQKRYGTTHVHRLLVDACFVQHPPHLDVQIILGLENKLIFESVQAITIHLVALHLAFERRVDFARVSKEMDNFLINVQRQKVEFLELQPPRSVGTVRVVDLFQAVTEQQLTLDEYVGLIEKYADQAWDAWSAHHVLIRKVYDKYK
jgi:hypothetical protein